LAERRDVPTVRRSVPRTPFRRQAAARSAGGVRAPEVPPPQAAARSAGGVRAPV